VTTGVSVGGALSTLLGASASSHIYDSYEKALGVANATDSVYAVSAYSPITDLDHADGVYEWRVGTQHYNGKPVNETDEVPAVALELGSHQLPGREHLDPLVRQPGHFTWAGFLNHVGRSKGLLAFDGFNREHPENVEFGNATTNAQHFTLFSVRHATGNPKAELTSDLP